MDNSKKKFQLKIIIILAAILLISLPDTLSAKIIFKGNRGGNFTVNDIGTGKFKRLLHNDLYMTVEFDLVTEDVAQMIEPEGVTIIHIAHFNDAAVKKYLVDEEYYEEMYEEYLETLNNITTKMRETNDAIAEVLSRASTVKKSAMTEKQREEEEDRWEEIDELTDEMTKYYDEQRNEYLDYIEDPVLTELYATDIYQKAEAAHASYKIRMTRIKEIGLGCFSMAGSATRIVFADIGSIVSFLSQAKDLFLWCKNNFNRTADDLYDDYHELDEALNALKRSMDESRIRSNLSRVEKSFNSYVKISKKFTGDAIDKIVDIQQFCDQIDNLNEALEEIKTGHRIKQEHINNFIKLKKELKVLEDSQVKIKEVAESIKEALTESGNIQKRKNTTVMKKQTELKRLESARTTGKTGKLKGFASIIGSSLTHIENIVSTISQIADAGLYER